MNFKPGDRVRIAHPRWEPATKGLEAVILAGPLTDFAPLLGARSDVYVIHIVGYRAGNWRAISEELEPLLDPGCEQFMEWIRALDKAPIRELQPDEMERVRG